MQNGEMMQTMKKKTKARSANARPATSARKTFSIGEQADATLEKMWRDHVTLDGRRARGKSDMLRDLIQRAWQAKKRRR